MLPLAFSTHFHNNLQKYIYVSVTFGLHLKYPIIFRIHASTLEISINIFLQV